MNKHVVLIDDSDRVLQTLKDAFIQLGVCYKCTWAKSGEQAVEQITYLLPDMVLLNVNIPGQDVFTTIAAIRRMKHTVLTPVIVYWFSLDNGSYLNKILPGSTAYLKRCSPDELVQVFKRYLLQPAQWLPR